MHNITKQLLDWYDQNHRILPWRSQPSGYRNLVSEVMLQQTRVDTVIPFFERFKETFPTIEHLAQAQQNEVMALWSGLGYYSRARNLHKCAQQIVALETFPSTKAELLKLSGVGPYIASAVASIAFGEDVAAIDGNLHRVLSRLFCDPSDRNAIEKRALELLPQGRAGDFNQALMDLGASFCSKKYNCGQCPLNQVCQAYLSNQMDKFPVLPKKKKPKKEFHIGILLFFENSVLVGQRPSEGLYGSMIEPLLIQIPEDQIVDSSFIIEQLGISESFLAFSSLQNFGSFEHKLTHKTMNITVIQCHFKDDFDNFGNLPQQILLEHYKQIFWCNEAELASYGISALAKLILEKGHPKQQSATQLSLF